MSDYKNYIEKLEDNAHLISMVPVDELLRFGYEAGLGENSHVLDLCCGYGTLLKVWNQTFGISGIGVDHSDDRITVGRNRLKHIGGLINGIGCILIIAALMRVKRCLG